MDLHSRFANKINWTKSSPKEQPVFNIDFSKLSNLGSVARRTISTPLSQMKILQDSLENINEGNIEETTDIIFGLDYTHESRIFRLVQQIYRYGNIRQFKRHLYSQLLISIYESLDDKELYVNYLVSYKEMLKWAPELPFLGEIVLNSDPPKLLDHPLANFIRDDNVEELERYMREHIISKDFQFNACCERVSVIKSPSLIEYATYYNANRCFDWLVGQGADLTAHSKDFGFCLSCNMVAAAAAASNNEHAYEYMNSHNIISQAICYAAEYHRKEMFDKMIVHITADKIKKRIYRACCKHDFLPQMEVATSISSQKQFNYACKFGITEIIVFSASKMTIDLFNGIYIASKHGCLQTIKIIAEMFPTIDLNKISYKMSSMSSAPTIAHPTPLCIAYEYRQYNVIKFLLSRAGIEIGTYDQYMANLFPEYDYETKVFIRERSSNEIEINKIFNSDKIVLNGQNTVSPLSLAVEKCDLLVVQKFLNAGFDPNYCGQVLSILIERRDINLLSSLIEAGGIDVNRPLNDDYYNFVSYPIYKAFSDIQIAKLIIDTGKINPLTEEQHVLLISVIEQKEGNEKEEAMFYLQKLSLQ